MSPKECSKLMEESWHANDPSKSLLKVTWAKTERKFQIEETKENDSKR
jgi:hypothetical protein